jgi:diguanylate cyclase (GGDEF)-like protein
MLTVIGLIAYAALMVLLVARSRTLLLATEAAQDAKSATDLQWQIERLRLRAAVAHMPYALAVVDGRNRIIIVNDRLSAMLGLDAAMLRQHPLLTDLFANAPARGIQSADDRAAFLRRATTILDSREPFTIALTLGDNSIVTAQGSPMPDDGWVLVLRDSTEERALLAHSGRDADQCPLTSLPNRQALLAELDRRLAGRDAMIVPADGQPFAMLLLDIDNFNAINARFGYAVGDRVIVAVAARIRMAAPDLFVARLNGDEFAILAPAPSASTLAATIDAIRAAVGSIPAGEDRITINLAIGVALAPADARDRHSLLRRADLALRAAKRALPECTVFYTDALEARADALNSVAVRVHAAIARRALQVWYQPIVDWQASDVVRMEALCRWPAIDTPRIPTSQIIDAAEQSGLLTDLRRIVLTQALADARRHFPELTLAVNISPRDLIMDGFMQEITGALHHASFPMQRLTLELDEPAFMALEPAAWDRISALRSAGARISIDNFAAGFSGLAQLQRCPVDEIKISSDLIAMSAAQPSFGDMLNRAVRYAKGLGIAVVAEGVETEVELAGAVAAGADMLQGFLLGHPVPPFDVSNEIIWGRTISASSRKRMLKRAAVATAVQR